MTDSSPNQPDIREQWRAQGGEGGKRAQGNLFPAAYDPRQGRTVSPIKPALRESNIARNGETVGFFDSQGHKVLNTDKFTIPERPRPQGEQLGFDHVQAENAIANGAQIRNVQDLRNNVSRAFLPTDPVMHRLRQQNPKLNDYQFNLYSSNREDDNGNVGGVHTVVANHRPFTTAIPPAVGRENIKYDIGNLDWHNASELTKNSRTYGRISGVVVDKAHRGQGIAEGMFDYATESHDKHHVSTAPMHDENRSMLGDIFAKRVGGPLPKREMGQDVYEYDF